MIYATQQALEAGRMWCPTLKDKGEPKICRRSWLKGMAKVGGSAKAYRALLLVYTLGTDIVILAPDLPV